MIYIREKEGKNENLKKEGKMKKNVYMYYIRVKEGKNEKEGKMRISILISLYTVHFAFLEVYTKHENTGSNRS